MAKSFWQKMKREDGTEVVVHVNRRGCKGRWTKKDDAALKALVEAIKKESDLRASDQGERTP